MAEWVYVENNKIKEYHGSLPRSWKNISGLDKSNTEYLKSLGWFQVQKNHISYDENIYKHDGYAYQILEDYVIETIKIVELTDQEKDERFQKRKEDFYSGLRQERNRRLTESDWTQVLDLQNMKSQEWRSAWLSYRQQLRDLPSRYENIQNYEMAVIQWPEQPSEK